MKTTVLCSCFGNSDPDPDCTICGGCGEVCGTCGNLGRVGDAVCPEACDAALPYYASLHRDPESIRLARELAVMLAANGG